MLMDDLLLYGRGDINLDRKVRNKCEADLIYYQVISHVIGRYGVRGKQDISKLNADALCIARNQMAMLASDDGLLRYDKDNRVEGFYNPETGRFDREFTDGSLRHFIRETFLNSEAMRTAVSKHLASDPQYRSVAMTDDEFEVLVDSEFGRILDPDDPDSLFNAVLADARSFDNTMGIDKNEYFAMNLPLERIVRDKADAEAVMAADRRLRNAADRAEGAAQSAYPGRSSIEPGSKIMDLDSLGRPRIQRALKLSPLMPEFETLRASGRGEVLGLYKDQRGHNKNVDGYDQNNRLLMFDPQKRVLGKAPVPALGGYSAEYLSLSEGAEFAANYGITFGPSEYMATQAFSKGATRVQYESEEFVEGVGMTVDVDMENSVERDFGPTPLQDASRLNAGRRSVYAWKMAQLLANHSGQSLTEGDYKTIQKIMDSAQGTNGTIFGNLDKDGEAAVEKNARAYFDYLDHVCGTVRGRMASHEFGIHFQEQNYFSDSNGLVPLLYFTGERTEDYNKARSNPSRYFGIYPFMNYRPANVNVSPLAGDIAPAAYNSYTITDMSHRQSAMSPEINDPDRNPFAHTTDMTAEISEGMKDLFDGYIRGMDRGTMPSGIRLVKINRRVGNTGLSDLKGLIRPDGSVDGRAVLKILVDDMNATKAAKREEFLSAANRGHMAGVFREFTVRNGGQDGRKATFMGALRSFYNNWSLQFGDAADGAEPWSDMTARNFSAALSEELNACVDQELRSSYGQDINSYAVMRHIFKSFAGNFANECGARLAADAGYLDASDVSEPIRKKPLTMSEMREADERGARRSEAMRRPLPEDFPGPSSAHDGYNTAKRHVRARMSNPADPTLNRSLRELFGQGAFEYLKPLDPVDPESPQEILIKANMCRYSSSQFMYQDYSDLLKLLSYSDVAVYEPDMAKPFGRAVQGLTMDKSVVIQLYASEAYDIYDAGDYEGGDGYAEDPDTGSDSDGNGNETGSEFRSASDDKLWFDSVFADPMDGARSLAWLDADYSGESAETDDPDWRSDPRFEHAVFEASHPLQCAALRLCGESLSRSEPDFDPARLRISRQGLVSYEDAGGNIAMKIGPVIDEEAYIRPIVMDDTWGDPGAVEITRVRLNKHGYPMRDKNGTALTEKALVCEGRYLCIDADGKLENDVRFGALDRRSTMPESQQAEAVNNRFYGISGKIAPYDGYDHTGKTFVDRMELSTYHMSVLENIRSGLALRLAARNGESGQASVTRDGEPMAYTDTPMARSLFYTNVSAGSLQKCYQSGTYLLDSKAKSRVGGTLMRNYMDFAKDALDIYPADALPRDDTQDELERSDRMMAMAEHVAGLHLTQGQTYRTRVVLPKITLDQNIGLYNQAVNLDLCGADDTNALDVKSMRDSDQKGARVGMFQYNLILDPVLSGSAKSLGAVAYLTDAVKFDPVLGRIEIDPETQAELDSGGRPNTRMPYVSTGVEDFITGSVTNLMPHSGGQAFDRQQLSGMGGMKALNYAADVKYAMINAGYNMEDGYIYADWMAEALGHHREDGSYVSLAQWDKTGDSESGNKGVDAKIVDTRIGRGMSDEDAEDEFMARYLFEYLQKEANCHGGPDFNGRNGRFWQAFARQADMSICSGVYQDNIAMSDVRDMLYVNRCPNGASVSENLDELKSVLCRKKQTPASREKAGKIREDIFQGVRRDLANIGHGLRASGIQPFKGAYELDHNLWRLFRDNPTLGAAVTNVCVCTRSNPSILMNIGEACDRDRGAMAEAEAASGGQFDKSAWLLEHGESVLVMRDENDEKIPVMGAVGKMSIYVDSHTAEDKNVNYNETRKSPKAGRRLAAQENFATQAERCCNDFFRFMLANDPALPDNLQKLNRKLLMNGMFAASDAEDLRCFKMADALDGKLLAPAGDPGDNLLYRSGGIHGCGFVDMSQLAKALAGQVPQEASADDIKLAVTSMGSELDFSKLLGLGNNNDVKAIKANAKSVDDKLHHMFVSAFGKDGGAFMLMPENLSGLELSADIGLKSEKQFDDPATGLRSTRLAPDPIAMSFKSVLPDGSERNTAPLFLSAKEISNPDAELITAPVDDRAQFKIFKTVLAAAVAQELHERDLIAAGAGHGRVPMLDDDTYHVVSNTLSSQASKLYENIPSEKSLELKGMNGWMKKNFYYMSVQDSLTCVWSGDPTLSVDEIGMSFETAKSMKILKPRKELTKEELRKIPDTFEFMHERYEPFTDDDLVLVNRSPGQTTGCIRAFHIKITGQSGGGITTNPACATVFDGDYDGDTVGMNDPTAPKGLSYAHLHPDAMGLESGTPEYDGAMETYAAAKHKYETMAAAAKYELADRMSMQGNMVHEADYTEIRLPDGSGEIKEVHPLFIAGNADYAIAKHNMRQEKLNPVTGQVEPACGYDIDRQIDAVTAMANMLYELRNCAYDLDNAADGRISVPAAGRIIVARQEQISDLCKFFDRLDPAAGTGRDQDMASEWAGIYEDFRTVRKAFLDGAQAQDADGRDLMPVHGQHADVLKSITDLEGRVFTKFREAYEEMTGHISSSPLMTHGETQHEILYNVIKDANISKKGKEPQLNALMSYASVGGRLTVIKNGDKKFELLTDGNTTSAFDPDIKMSNANPVSDVPKSPFRTQIESHTVAQSDKSDATGIGGAVAQKFQKMFAIAGYGGFALRVSGPITQSYLDAKQNVTKCSNNLKIGKFAMDGVARFQKFDEFTDASMSGADLTQVFRGQYTKSMVLGKKGRMVPVYMTARECVEQLDNFIQVMGHPGFTNIDKAIAEACLERFQEPDRSMQGEDQRLIVKDPIKKADAFGDMSYAIMYGSDNGFAATVARMAENKMGLYSGSFGFEGKLDPEQLTRRILESAPEMPNGALDHILGQEARNPGPDQQAGLGDIPQEDAARIVRDKVNVIKSRLTAEQAKDTLESMTPKEQPVNTEQASDDGRPTEEMFRTCEKIDQREREKSGSGGQSKSSGLGALSGLLGGLKG